MWADKVASMDAQFICLLDFDIQDFIMEKPH